MVKRRLNNAHQRCAKRETDNHRDTERESHLHDGPAQVFQMLQKRFGGFGLWRITKFKNISQRHRVTFVRMPSGKSCARREREETASGEHRTNAKRISVANFIVGDHAADLFAGESTTI